MNLGRIAGIIYEEDTASESTQITVKTYHQPERILWQGKAKDLKHQKNLHSFLVVEVLVDHNKLEDHLPDYNKGKVLMVI